MSVIFNEPGGGQTLSNPSQQNNVFQFVQTTKPTERSAGVALVAGDRWYNSSDGTSWFWNGTYWLTQTLYGTRFVYLTNWGATETRNSRFPFTDERWSGVFVIHYSAHITNGFNVPWNSSNYTDFTINILAGSGSLYPMLTFRENNRTVTNQSSTKIIKELNYFRSISELPAANPGTQGLNMFQVAATKVGSGTNVAALENVAYRGVAP